MPLSTFESQNAMHKQIGEEFFLMLVKMPLVASVGEVMCHNKTQHGVMLCCKPAGRISGRASSRCGYLILRDTQQSIICINLSKAQPGMRQDWNACPKRHMAAMLRHAGGPATPPFPFL